MICRPKIRFPQFNDDWEYKKLSELLIESKKRNEELKFSKDEVLSVSGESGIVNQIEHMGRSYAGVSVHQYHVVEVGDIVYTKSPLKANPFGIIKLNKGKAGIVSTLYAVYKVNPKTAYGAFIDCYFSLDSNTNRYLRPLVKKGAKNDMKINNAYVLHDKIFAPTIPEQVRIATFFTVLDKKIAELKQKKSLLEQYKKGVMQKLFSQELRFTDENGRDFPDWKSQKIKEYIDFLSGYAFKGVDISENASGIPLLRGVSITEGKLRRSEEIDRFYCGELSKIGKYIIKKGDIVIGMDGSKVGKNSALVDASFDNALLVQRVARIRGTPKGYLLFIYHHINSSLFHRYVDEVKTSSGIPHISAAQINDFKINFPCYQEQVKIANFLSAIDEKLKRTENQIEQTQKYKKGLLQQMFC